MSARKRYSLAVFLMMLGPARAQIDPVPVIVTYEIKKQRQAVRAAARHPQAFWVRQIVARIEGKKRDLAKALKQPAVVQLGFVIGRDGKLVSKSIAKSSGSSEADKTAIAILERAQPFPPMPAGMSDREMAFTLPVRFR